MEGLLQEIKIKQNETKQNKQREIAMSRKEEF